MQTIESYLTTNTKFTKAVVAFLLKEHEVLLGYRKQVSNKLGEHLISGIGGKLEAGETEVKALIRELQEEIQVTVTDFRKVGRVRFLFPYKPAWQQDVAIFLVDNWEGSPAETEVIKPSWHLQDQLPLQQMWADNRYWLPKVLSGEKIDAIYLYNHESEVVEESAT